MLAVPSNWLNNLISRNELIPELHNKTDVGTDTDPEYWCLHDYEFINWTKLKILLMTEDINWINCRFVSEFQCQF